MKLSSGCSSSLQQRAHRRRRSRGGLLVADAESSPSPLQSSSAQPPRRIRDGLAIGELVGAAENYSPSPSPQQRATSSESASPLESSLKQQRVLRRRVRELVDVGELGATTESSSSSHRRASRRSRGLVAATGSSASLHQGASHRCIKEHVVASEGELRRRIRACRHCRS